jgi:hypothetical protein
MSNSWLADISHISDSDHQKHLLAAFAVAEGEYSTEDFLSFFTNYVFVGRSREDEFILREFQRELRKISNQKGTFTAGDFEKLSESLSGSGLGGSEHKLYLEANAGMNGEFKDVMMEILRKNVKEEGISKEESQKHIEEYVGEYLIKTFVAGFIKPT